MIYAFISILDSELDIEKTPEREFLLSKGILGYGQLKNYVYIKSKYWDELTVNREKFMKATKKIAKKHSHILNNIGERNYIKIPR